MKNELVLVLAVVPYSVVSVNYEAPAGLIVHYELHSAVEVLHRLHRTSNTASYKIVRKRVYHEEVNRPHWTPSACTTIPLLSWTDLTEEDYVIFKMEDQLGGNRARELELEARDEAFGVAKQGR